MRTITLNELQELISQKTPLSLLEALPVPYFNEGHLPGAQSFPHTEAAALAPSSLPDMEAAVIVYCTSDTCKNSHYAAETLIQFGYTDVRVFVGGKKEWLAAGLPLER